MPRGRNKPLSREEEWAILEAYESGKFIKEIVRKLHHGVGSVRKVLDAAGVRAGLPAEEAYL